MIRRLALLIAVLALAVSHAVAGALDLTEAERRAILRHGPWPEATAADPSNRVAGQPAAIALGRLLFFDPRLSADGSVSCATCHQPGRAWTDGRPVAHGLRPTDRNTLGLLGVGGQRWFGWDGGGDTLWGQSLRPILDKREMGGSLDQTARLLRDDPELACRYRRVFGRGPDQPDAETVAVDAAKALAAFQAELTHARSPFDAFRDALAAGDDAAALSYPPAARRGAVLFTGRGRCAACHVGPAFINREFHDIGIPFFVAGGVDPGRHGGINRARSSRHGQGGPFSDSPDPEAGALTRQLALLHRNWGEFRVPSLRDVARTAPYMHNGSLPDLRAVVRHYAVLDEDRLHADGEALLKPLRLTEQEIDDLVAFLESLTGAPAAIPVGDPAECRPP